MAKATVKDVNVFGKTVFLRCDYNVPLKGGEIADDTRIRASLPTLNYLIGEGAKVVLASHLGRPKGTAIDSLRMDPVAERLGEILGRPVTKVEGCVEPLVTDAVKSASFGDIVLLENLRFYPGEEKNDPGFSKKLASLADIFVNDAFGAAHRRHASTAGIADYIPAYAGFLMEKELEALSGLLKFPERPFVAMIGGAKVSDKLKVLDSLLDKVDSLLVGGGMANTFLLALGCGVGNSLAEPSKVEDALRIMDKAKKREKEPLLPVDVVTAVKPEVGATANVFKIQEIPAGEMALDIGPLTRKEFVRKILAAKTLFWNGPLGVFEVETFRGGTMEMASAVSRVNGFTVVGGGDSLSAIKMSGLEGKMSHLSTGGGASLEFLEGRVLPGVACIKDK